MANPILQAIFDSWEAEFKSKPVDFIGGLSVVGSKAYGLDNAFSDTDVRGWYYLPEEMMFGFARRDVFTAKLVVDGQKIDVALFSLPKFIAMLQLGDLLAVEMVSADAPNVMYTGKPHTHLRNNAAMFRSAKYLESIVGALKSFVRKWEKSGKVDVHQLVHGLRLASYGLAVIFYTEFSVAVSPNRIDAYKALLDNADLTSKTAIQILNSKIEKLQHDMSSNTLPKAMSSLQIEDWLIKEQRDFYEFVNYFNPYTSC